MKHLLSLLSIVGVAAALIGFSSCGDEKKSPKTTATEEDPDFWSDYGEFLTEMTTYLHAKDSKLRVGFVATFDGLTKGPLKEQGIFKALAGAVDFVGVTYYPNDTSFHPRAPDVPKADFALLAQEFGDKPLFITEVGYHTPNGLKDGELNQAKFFCNVFQEWDNHPTIQLLGITRLQNVSHQEALDLAGPYGIDSEAFVEFLETLGLRTHPGKGADKLALAVIREQAKIRGF